MKINECGQKIIDRKMQRIITSQIVFDYTHHHDSVKEECNAG